MRFYIAARFDKKQEVLEIYRRLQDRGYIVSSDWTQHKPIKPYENNQELARRYSIEDIEGVINSDIFIVLSDDAGTGMYVELGAAIATNLQKGRPIIYVVGENTSRSMFYFHTIVRRRKTIDEVLEDIEIIKEIEAAL